MVLSRGMSSGVAERLTPSRRALSTEQLCLIVCIAIGTVQAWFSRYTMISDGVSYLDIGDAYFRRDWPAAINAYWSPMYSWLLGLALYLLKPSIWWEYATVHLVNLIIFLVALFCFRFFLHCILKANREEYSSHRAEAVSLDDDVLLGLGYALFLLCSIVLIDVGWISPDLLVAGILFVLCGCLVSLRVRHSFVRFVLFGLLCGLGYLSKGVMFPLGFAFLAVLLFSLPWTKRYLVGTLLAGVVFLIVCSPFVIALSRSKGRFTYGDTGKLAYAALVSPGAALGHWQGKPPESGTPMHPTRSILQNPPVFEFAEPIRGTYPLWDDPSYWHEGVKTVVRLRPQLSVLVKSAFAYEKLLIAESGIFVGILIFLFLGGQATRKAIASNWPLFAMAVLGIVVYSFVLVLPRYVGGAITVLWLGLFASVRLPNDARVAAVSKYIVIGVAVSVLFTVAGHITETAYNSWAVTRDPAATDQIKAALALRDLGLHAGESVAVVGDGGTNHWARLGRFRIIAESPLAQRFWVSSLEQRELAFESFRRVGAKAVVAWAPADVSLDARWMRLGGTEYYAYFFGN